MAVTGKVTMIVDAPLDEAYQKFCDYSLWDQWMPAGFRPVKGPARVLQAGDNVKVKLKAVGPAMTVPLKVFRATTNKEITWGGGPKGLLHAEHCFFFEDAGEGRTRIRSEETFKGALTLPAPGLMKKEIERIGGEQLQAFSTWISR